MTYTTSPLHIQTESKAVKLALRRFAFSLGRENKLSLAELISLFGNDAYIEHTDEIALFGLHLSDSEIQSLFRSIGGSVRVMRLLDETDGKKFPTDVISAIESARKKQSQKITPSGQEVSGKVTFAL